MAIDGSDNATPEQRREQAREAILKATWVALARDGYEKITTRRIAQIAGVNIATLHYYFGTKEALLSEATRFALKDTEEQLHRAMAESTSARAALERVFATILDMVKDRPGILRYDLIVRGFRDEVAREDAIAIYESYRALTEELIAWNLREGGTLSPGLTISGIAHYVLAAVDGVLLQHVLTGDDTAARNALGIVAGHALALMNITL